MDKRTRLVISVLILLPGCTTPYRPPTERPPEEWMGGSGWTVHAERVKVFEGVRAPGDVLLEFPMSFTRTGVLLETVQTRDGYGNDFIIPAGTKLFAMNFTLKGGQAIDPIEWCAVLPDGVDGKQEGSDTACLFWETPDRVLYKQDHRTGGFAFNPRMVGSSGVIGPMPRIRVQPVDFGVEIVSRLRVVSVDPKRVELETVLSDGTSAERTDRTTLEWNSTGKARYENVIGPFDLTASRGYSSVQFTQVVPEPGLPIVRVCVDSTGALSGEPEIATSSDSTAWDAAAINIAREGRYTPGGGNDGADCFKFRVNLQP
jgi:hypothetical protein